VWFHFPAAPLALSQEIAGAIPGARLEDEFFAMVSGFLDSISN